MKKKLSALLIILGLLLSVSFPAGAASIDIAPLGAPIDAGVTAADYEVVGSSLEPDAALPASYSSVELGYTTPIRSQNYNTCWAYCSTAVTEVMLNKNDIGTGQLSPMAMNYWAVTNDDGTGWQRTYTSAGYPYIALGYLTSNGAVREADLPDTASYEEYRQAADSLTPYVYADGVIYLDGTDIDTVKAAVYRYGATIGNFHYSAAMLNDTTSAYYCDIETIATANLFGHAIAIVGWDDNYSIENFREEHRPKNSGAWLCKNSWGEYWGSIGGYFWISYEDMHLFDHRFGPSYAITDVTLAADRVERKQNEIYGATYSFDYVSEYKPDADTMTYANVLDFSDGYDVIDKIVFSTSAEGSAYEIYYIPVDENGVPIDDQALWTALASGTVGYSGYLCADIEDFTVPDAKGAIGVRITRTEQSEDIGIGVDEWLTSGGKYLFLPQSERGMSYLLGYTDGAYDVMDFYRDHLDDEIGGTFVIKAVARTDRLMGDIDGDGIVTILDCTHIQRYLADLDVFNKAQRLVADYDGDGIISILDCTRIQRMLAGFSS